MLKTNQTDTTFPLMDKKGDLVPAKMKIVLSRISGSIDDVKGLMEKVDADVGRLRSNDALTSTVSTLALVLQLTKTIMDKVSQVRQCPCLLYIG